MTEEPDLRGTVFAGCTISEKLGKGGMGTVYKARHEALDKFVCVKLLSPELAREQRNIDFFLREARSAAKLEHPNIVHIYNFGQENGSHFIVMSYVEGKSLQDLVAQRGPLPVAEATALIAGILDGLAHAHSKNIIHRDIKPENILIDSEGIPHIVDFGLARSISEEKQLTMAGEMIGTAYFMSPEQCLSRQVDTRADLYSIGATYFYIMTGKYPFEGKTSIEVIHKHISEPAPNPLLINPNIPLWAARIIERLLNKKAEHRFQKAEDVALTLRKHNSGELNTVQTSTETTFDLPELTSRLTASPPLSTRQSGHSDAAGHIKPDAQKGEQAALTPAHAAAENLPEPANSRKPPLQLTMLHSSIRVATHLALTTGACGCFILAGASGRISGTLSNPLTSNPIVAGIFAFFGLALYTWALRLKPKRITLLYSAFALTAAAAAYASGAYIPAPDGTDTAAKSFLAISIALANLSSATTQLVYSFCLYLLAAKIAFREHRLIKAIAIAAYIGSLALTYSYFKTNLPVIFPNSWLIAAGAFTIFGLILAITQSQPSVFINSQLFFLGANLAIIAMCTSPQVENITQARIKINAQTVNHTDIDNQEDYLRALKAPRPEVLNDLIGRPIEKQPSAPPELRPAEISALRGQARREYYTKLSQRITADLADSAGIVFIGLFLTLMANICYIEELWTA